MAKPYQYYEIKQEYAKTRCVLCTTKINPLAYQVHGNFCGKCNERTRQNSRKHEYNTKLNTKVGGVDK